MKLHKKPDLLTLLAVFVGVGIVFTSLTHFSQDHTNTPVIAASPTTSTTKDATLFKGNFVQVSSGKQRIQIEN